MSPRSRQSAAMSSPSAGSVSFHQTCSLSRALRRPAAALDDQRRLAEMPDQMVELGGDVAGVEIDHHRLHLQDVGGLGLAVLGDRAGDDIDSGSRLPTARCPPI